MQSDCRVMDSLATNMDKVINSILVSLEKNGAMTQCTSIISDNGMWELLSIGCTNDNHDSMDANKRGEPSSLFSFRQLHLTTTQISLSLCAIVCVCKLKLFDFGPHLTDLVA